jgi:hypothetical protein
MPEPRYEYTVRMIVLGGLMLDGRIYTSLEEAERQFSTALGHESSLDPLVDGLVLLRREVAPWQTLKDVDLSKRKGEHQS